MSNFYFDQDAADRAVQFFPECLVHVKGEKAGQPFHLHPSHAKECKKHSCCWHSNLPAVV
jgi:hypothetical protein